MWMLLLLLFFSPAKMAASWSKTGPSTPFHHAPLQQQLSLYNDRWDKQSVMLKSSSKPTAVLGTDGGGEIPKKIPGGSPLRFCDESRDTDLFAIDYIELQPFPLYIDDVFEVHLYGTFLQTITPNATFTMLAKYDSPSNPDHESGSVDFCSSMDSIDQLPPLPSQSHPRTQSCPPEEGYALIMMSAWVMPMFIVPGNYYFKFDAVTKRNQRIYCLETEIYLDERKTHHTLSR